MSTDILSQPTDLVRDVGRSIRRVRLSHDLSVAQVSDATGVSVTTIQRLERGTQNTRLDGALRVALYLRDVTGVSLDELLKRAVPGTAGRGGDRDDPSRA